MSPSLALTLAFAVALALGLLLKLWLASRQVRHVARHRETVPLPFDRHITLASHQKAADYTVAKARFGLLETALGMAEQLSGWTLDATTGVITFTTAPAGGVIIRAGFEFDVPVRFDSDTLDVTLDFERLGSITSIPLLEIRR